MLADSLSSQFDVGSVSECAETEISFAAGAESGTGRTYYMALRKQFVEEFPRAKTIGRFHPDIWCIFATKSLNPHLVEAAFDDLSILHVVIDEILAGGKSILAHGCDAPSLYDVCSAVEEGILSARPEGVELTGSGIFADAVLGHDGPGEAHPREAGGLGEAVDFHGTFASAFHLVDATGKLGVGDKGGVGGVVEDYGLVLAGVINDMVS